MLKAITTRLQTKLTLAFVLVMLVPVAVIVAYNIITYRDSLIDNITQGEIDNIQTQAARVGQSLEAVRGNTLFLSDDPAVSRYLNILTNQTVDPGALNFVQGLFSAFITNNPVAIKDVRILDVRGQEVVRVDNTDGTPEVITGSELENKADRPYFTNAINLPDGEIYISGFDLNQTLTEYDVPYVPVIRYSTPLFTTNGTLAGVLVVKIFAEPLLAPLSSNNPGEITYIIDADGSYLLHPNPEVLYGSILGIDSRFTNDQPADAALMGAQQSGYILGSQYQPDRLQTFARVLPAGQPTIDWLVIHSQPLQNIYNAINTPLIVQVVISLIATVLAIAAAFFIARTIVNPLRQLSTAAQAIGAGEKNVSIPTVKSEDEIGDLARAFNTMSQELGAIYESLEDRIASRTADLETSAEISSAANQVREVDDLLSLAVNLIRDRFDFYYVQVYLVQGDQAVLREGTGYVGRRLINRGHSLPLDGRSLVATTISTGKPQIVQDTRSDPNFLPNDLLPDTRAEITIPLRTKTDIVGVLDIQHNKANAFDESSQRLFQSMADQLAVTFENVNLFESTQRRALQLQTVAEVSAAAASNLNTDELLKQVSDLTKERFQLYHAHIYLYDEDAHSLVLTAGAGETGRIMKDRGHSIPFDLERSLVARAARTRKGVIVNNVTTEPGFLANPLLPNTKSELAIPMIVNNELIGVLDIQSDQLNRFDDEDLNVQNALAGQIAVAINNARAFEQTRQQEQRFRSLVTNIPNTIYRCLYDANSTMLFLSDSIEQLTGYPPAALVNNHVLSYHSLIHPDDAPMVEAAVREGVHNRAPYLITYRITRADSSIRWVEERGQASFDEKGQVEWLDGAFVDITDRRADEEERTVLGEISNRLVAAGNQHEILAAFQVYGDLIQADSTSLLYIDSNIDGEAEWGTVVAEWSKDGTATGLLNVPLKLSDFAIARLWMSDPNMPFFIENIENDFRVDEPTREIYTLTGSKASVILPLNLQGRWIGLIVYNWKNPIRLTEAQRNIFIGIMQRATLAIDAARASEAIIIAQEEAELLYVVSREINSAANEQDLVEVLVRHIAHEEALRVSLILWDTLDYDTASTVNIVATWNRGASVAPTNVPINSIPFFSVLNRYDIAYSNDVPNDPRIDEVTRATLENLGYVAFILVPLTVGERWLGSLNVLTDKPHIHTERQIRLLRGAAEQLTTAVQRLLSLRQAERRAAELATVARVSATTTTLLDVESLLVAVSELTKENFNLYHAHVYLLDESGENLMLAAGAGEAGHIMKIAEHSIPFNREQSLVARAARTQQGVIVNDVTQSENFLPNPLLPETKSELAVPLRVGTDLLGVLDVQSDQVNRFSEEDVNIQTALADQIAVAITNARAFERVTEAERLTRQSVKSLEDLRFAIDEAAIVAITDVSGKITYANDKFLEISKYSLDELIGQDHRIINSGYHSKDFIRDLWVTIANGKVWNGELRNRNKQGEIYWVDTTIVPLLNEQGKPEQYIAIRYEITERKFAEEERSILSEMSTRLVSANSRQDFVEAFKYYGDLINVDATFVLYIDIDAQGTPEWITIVAEASADGSPSGLLNVPLRLADFAIAKLWMADPGNPLLIEDTANDPRVDLPTQQVFQQIGTQASVILPLNLQGRWVGLITYNWGKTVQFNEQQKRIFTGIMQRAALAIDNARSTEAIVAAREESELLYQVGKEINAARSEQELVEIIVNYFIHTDTTVVALSLWENLDFDSATAFTTAARWSRDGNPASTNTLPISHFPFLPFIDRRGIEVCDDVTLNSKLDAATRELFQSLKVNSYVFAPLTIGQRWIGIMGMYSDKPYDHDERLPRMLRGVTEQLAASVERLANLRQAEKRAAELATVAEVSAAATSTLDVDALLTQVSTLTKERFDLYHVHIYLLDKAQESLALAAGSGEAGIMMREAGHAIPLDSPRSLVARAARLRKGVIANDVTQEPGFLPNPLLPDTQSELAVPLVVGTTLIGVLDVQGDTTNRFTDEDVRIQTTLADQIAVAVNNARAFEIVRASQEALGEQRTFLQRVLDNAPSSIFVKDYEGRFVMANVAQASMFLSTVEDLIGKTDHDFNPNPDEVAAYLEADRRVMDTGEPLFIAEEPVTNSDGLTKWYQTTKVPLQTPDGTKQVLGIATDITERKEAAQAIETAREESDLLYLISKEINAASNEEELVDVAVRYLVYPEATAASLVLWDELDFDKAKAVTVAARWSRDNNFQRPMVVPLSRFPFVTLLDRHNIGVFDDIANDARVDDIGRETLASLGYRAFIFAPLTVGERWVGNLGIYSDKPHKHSDRLVRLMRGVVEQLTSAVERLNVLRQAEKRASELATVARVSAATTTILEVDELLRSVSELTKESFNLYHAHIYLINDAGDNLILAGGAGEAGHIMKEEGHAIPLKRINSLVARAARSRKGVVSNDVTQEPDFLPNPLLPETKSELAIPMVIGNELLGVLDVQADVINRFSEEDIRIKATLADQIAVAVNNARIYEVERESAEHLREVDRLKSQFLANMSHELRTPLNSIIGYSEVLLDGVDGELPDEAVEDVEAIHDSGKHLLALINEILDMAKIDAGQLHLDRKPAEVARIVSEVLKVGQSLIKEKPLTVEVVEDTPVPTVMVDALRVRQILINLVGNAVKFTEQGTITISYGLLNEREAYIKVRDTGVGISEDNLKVVFERFRQVDGSSTRRAGGTGLGLSITQQLVQLHGGDIYAESEPGVGSIFWFTLPVIETPAEPAKEVSKVTTNGKH